MRQKFTIHDRLPGLNEYINQQRANKYGGNMMKRYIQKEVEWEIRAAKLRPIRGRVFIHYTFHEPDKRRDKDNIAAVAYKVIQDALVATGILRGDGWDCIENWDQDFLVDKTHPHIDVELIYKE